MAKLSENALAVLRARYLKKDGDGRVMETPEEMFRRIARAFAAVEARYHGSEELYQERFYQLLSSFRFLPNSPALMHAGLPDGQLAACFVLPIEDSMPSIFETLKNAAVILQSGGGTGFSFSRLRPAADPVNTSGGVASGPVSFMKIYNAAAEVVKQGGARRGANMGILRIDHPDVIDFIRLKRNPTELVNFNVSVAVTDAFMEAVRQDAEYPLINPRTGLSDKSLRASLVFDELVESAWMSGDPGIVFIDRMNEQNPTPHLGDYESTNPCGEQPLLPYEACILGSLNLPAYVRDGSFDYMSLGDDIAIAVRMLDNAIDANCYPLREIELMHKGTRKIGLGVMGWADALIMLGIPYDSPEACAKARRIMGFIQKSAQHVSEELAQERGPFSFFTGSVYERMGVPPRRNATLTSIAPTGTISLIAGCSSGIEPLYLLAFKRRVLDEEQIEVNRYFVETARREGFYSDKLMECVMGHGSVRGLRTVPSRFRRLFMTAHEISYVAHIEMQAAFQEFTDNAVAKTINLPHRATRDIVRKAFLLAYEKRLKGITVFRAGTKPGTLGKVNDPD